MFATLADFLLGAGLSRRAAMPAATGPRRSPSRFRDAERGRSLGWIARVGTY